MATGESSEAFGVLPDHGFPLGNQIEWASARVPPTPLLGGWAEGGWCRACLIDDEEDDGDDHDDGDDDDDEEEEE